MWSIKHTGAGNSGVNGFSSIRGSEIFEHFWKISKDGKEMNEGLYFPPSLAGQQHRPSRHPTNVGQLLERELRQLPQPADVIDPGERRIVVRVLLKGGLLSDGDLQDEPTTPSHRDTVCRRDNLEVGAHGNAG